MKEMNAVEIVTAALAAKGETPRYIIERSDAVEVGLGARVVAYYIVRDGKVVNVIFD